MLLYGGRSNGRIKAMVSRLLFVGMEKLTGLAAEFLFRQRAGLGAAENAPAGRAQIDRAALFKFYQRLTFYLVSVGPDKRRIFGMGLSLSRIG